MKLRANRERLLDAFTVVSSVVPLRSIKPILQNVRLVVAPDEATLLATDLEVALRYRIPLESVEEGGDVLIPAARVLGILRESSADEVEIISEDGTVHFRCGSGRFKVLSEDPEEFPVVPAFEDDEAFTMQRDPLRTLIRKTSFATAKERTRFAFNGVRFEVEGDVARMIATDGKRMAVKEAPIDNPDELKVGRIIPNKGLQTFDKVLGDDDETVRILLQEKQAMMRTSRAEVSTRLVEGAFPDFKSVIPKETRHAVEFEHAELFKALRQAAILTSEESRSVRFSLSEDGVTLTSRAIDVGEAQVDIDARFDGDPIEVSFNPDYVLEGLKVIEAENVTLRLSGRDTPALVDGEENFTYVIMPVTIRTG